MDKIKFHTHLFFALYVLSSKILYNFLFEQKNIIFIDYIIFEYCIFYYFLYIYKTMGKKSLFLLILFPVAIGVWYVFL